MRIGKRGRVKGGEKGDGLRVVKGKCEENGQGWTKKGRVEGGKRRRG